LAGAGGAGRRAADAGGTQLVVPRVAGLALCGY